MEKSELFKQYQKYITDLTSLTSSEDACQSSIAQEERNLVSEIENEYMQLSSTLQMARQTISGQYRSVWESCKTNANLQKPEAQRPAYTDLNWKECIRIQEQAAKEIQEWFEQKQQAVAEKKRKLQLEASCRAASALSAAEAERRRKEEAAALEEKRGAILLEEMKRKYRKNS